MAIQRDRKKEEEERLIAIKNNIFITTAVIEKMQNALKLIEGENSEKKDKSNIKKI